MAVGKTFATAKPKSGNDRIPRISDLVDTIKVPTEYINIRLLSGISSYAVHWVEFTTGPKSKTPGKKINLFKACLAYSASDEDFSSGKPCPYCAGGSRATVRYLANVIVRDLQEDEPAKKPKPSATEAKSGHKDKASKTWTPVRVLDIPASVADKLSKLAATNKVKNKKTGEVDAYDLSDAKYGRNLEISFDGDKAGAAKWDIQKGDTAPLTEEEQAYLIWNIDDCVRVEDATAAKAEAAKLLGTKAEGSEYTEDSDVPAPKKKTPAKKAAVSEDSEADANSDESEDDKPSPKKTSAKKAPAKKPASSFDSEESEEDAGSDASDTSDESEDDKPAPKSKTTPAKPAPKKKGAESDTSDNSDDSEDDKPAPKKTSAKTVAASEDSDEDSADSEASEEDKPAPKKTSAKKPAAKSSKKAALSDMDSDADSDDDIPF